MPASELRRWRPCEASVHAPRGYAADVSPGFGATDPERLQLEFYAVGPVVSIGPGTVALGTGSNANYETCTTCVRVFQDIAGEIPAKQFFARSGSLVLRADALQSHLDATLVDVVLEEVTLTPDFISTPVTDGACISIPTATLSTSPPTP